ncbi:hypothetical protein TURU_129901 [Turdus rufiventris]|nr:hypothetical protein TURU_129901 [Turdus rufiventris]
MRWVLVLITNSDTTDSDTMSSVHMAEERSIHHYCHWGYSVAGLHIPARVLVAAGAPCYRHVGVGVVHFKVPRATRDWKVLQTLGGEKRFQGKVVALGCFFGQAVASGLDLTGDELAGMAVGMERYIMPCLKDFVTPIHISVTIALPHRDPPGHILPPSSAPTWAEIPFEQNCGADEVCKADLGVKVMSRDTAVLGPPSAELGVQLIVENTLALAPMPILCWDSQGIVGKLWGLTCNLSCPILCSG